MIDENTILCDDCKENEAYYQTSDASLCVFCGHKEQLLIKAAENKKLEQENKKLMKENATLREALKNTEEIFSAAFDEQSKKHE